MNDHPASALRQALPHDVEPLAELWHHGWHDAHAANVPAALTRLRTLDSFAQRMAAMLDDTRVAEAHGQPIGFCTIKDDELIHLFVAPEARGSGVAAQLLADGEDRLARRGVPVAWLACVIGNHRAARFYAKHGWAKIGTMVNTVDTSAGPFALEEWRYEKTVA